MQFIFSVPQRRDNGVWSLPGGMVDPGEGVTTTLVRWICVQPHQSISYWRANMDVLLLKRAVLDLVNNIDLL